jgi:hypothetical protein
MSKTFLLTRPSYDLITNYFFYWSKKLIDLANNKGITVIDLQREKVNQKELSGRLMKTKPQLVLLNGHGSEVEVAGHDNGELITLKNASDLSGSIIYARSCSSAHTLGQLAVSSGARAYIGYVVPFYMGYDKEKSTHPLDDKIAELFLTPSNHVVVSLLKGHKAQDASNRSKDLSRKTVQALVTSTATTESMFYAKLIWSNMQNQVCHGNGNARI